MSASERIIEPSKFRGQHGKVEVAAEQIVDAHGMIGAPYRALSLLDEWERAGRITPKMHQAGDEFHRLFRLACLDPLQAADMGRVGGCQAHGGHLGGSVHARNEVHAALLALGGFSSPLGSVGWFVLGCEFSLRKWAGSGVWGADHHAALSGEGSEPKGKPIDVKVAAGLLIGALDRLQKHFGY